MTMNDNKKGDLDAAIARAEAHLEKLKRERVEVPNGWEVVTAMQWRRVVASERVDLCAMINHAPTITVKLPVRRRTNLSLPEAAREIEDALIGWCHAVLDELGDDVD